MSDATDAALLSSINSLKDKRAKYQRVKNAISSNSLSYKRNLSNLKSYIDHCKNLIELIDGNVGYAYLANFRSKLQEDKDTLQEYYDYCTDANASFVDLYNTLDTKISQLNTSISQKKSAYNDGKPLWEWIW
ncbi:hypothetical protein ACVR05_02155 [Streptococcus caprae]|uniref:DUF5082 domain-containing protein n=1 Tax=Streptococcus caprae TaxID=1640501 RepID=A0ABV8CX61_9STRE